MMSELKTGMRVRWVENPNFDLATMKPGMMLGPQLGEIKRMKKNKKTGLTAVLVMNKDGKHFHWIEADTACDILSPAEY